jgi:hypothetical protein
LPGWFLPSTERIQLLKPNNPSVSPLQAPPVNPRLRYNIPVKQLRRAIFNALTGLSLLLCVAIVVLWVRSYQHRDCFMRVRQNDYTNGDGSTESSC